MICSKIGCEDKAEIQVAKRAFYCKKHYRFETMRGTARRCKKTVPTFGQLDECLSEVSNMTCPNCGKKMIWYAPQKIGLADVISLQHWPDGDVSFMCLGCNSSKGNSKLKDKKEIIPVSHKRCQVCHEIKNKTQFSRSKNRRDGLYGLCKACDSAKRVKRKQAIQELTKELKQ